jgi:hypothetical protein
MWRICLHIHIHIWKTSWLHATLLKTMKTYQFSFKRVRLAWTFYVTEIDFSYDLVQYHLLAEHLQLHKHAYNSSVAFMLHGRW